MKQVVMIGAGGHSKVIADIISLCGDRVLGVLDDKTDICSEFEIIGTTNDIGKLKDCYYFPAIGNAEARKKIMQKAPDDTKWYTAIHPTAVIASSSEIGEASAVMANAVVCVNSKIGKGVILNTACSVDHGSVIEDFVHISPGAHLAGNVFIGEETWVGIGACVSNNVRICKKCTVGAGAAVIKDIDECGTYVGVPAGKIK